MKKIESKIPKKVECSECGSKDTYTYNVFLNVSIFLAIFGCVGTFICAIIPLFWIALPITFIAAVIGFIGLFLSLFIKDYRAECKQCKSKFKLTKEEYKNL